MPLTQVDRPSYVSREVMRMSKDLVIGVDCSTTASESWWTATAQALRDAIAQVNPDRLAALCITLQRETFVPIDEQGQPMRRRPLKLWPTPN